MGDIVSFLYLSVFCFTGLLLARRLAPQLSREGLWVLGGAFSLSMLAALPALFALVFGFHLTAALLALLAVVLIGVFTGLSLHRSQTPRFAKSGGKSFWLCVLPLLALTGVLLFTHTLWLRDGAYWCGQSTYGDLTMHLHLINSIPRQESFPPHYPLLAGQQVLGYPFLCETVSSIFVVLGAGLKFACLLPQTLAAFVLLGGGWLLAKELLCTNGKANLAYWLFFMGSGFGFAYFFGGGKENFTRIFTAFYETPTNYVEENIRWVNPIVDMMVPQRASLFGWALLFPALALLARFALNEETDLWKALFVIAIPLPLVHTHSALSLVMISAVLFLRAALTKKSLRALTPWFCWAACTGAVWLPQLFGVIFRQTSEGRGFLKFHFNWANDGDNYFWFYIKNLGLVYLLLIPAFLWAGKKLRWFYGGGLFILAVSEIILFQPNPYDNNKLLFIWHLLGCILVANLLMDLAKQISKRSVRYTMAALVLTVCTVGSVLTVGRELVSKYQHWGPDAIAAAEYAKTETEPDALFLTGQQHVNAVASLAGCDLLCGASNFLFYNGMNYQRQADAARQMYEAPTKELFEEWGVDYAVISSWERGDFAVNENWYRQNCELVFEEGEYSIYKIQH